MKPKVQKIFKNLKSKVLLESKAIKIKEGDKTTKKFKWFAKSFNKGNIHLFKFKELCIQSVREKSFSNPLVCPPWTFIHSEKKQA